MTLFFRNNDAFLEVMTFGSNDGRPFIRGALPRGHYRLAQGPQRRLGGREIFVFAGLRWSVTRVPTTDLT